MALLSGDWRAQFNLRQEGLTRSYYALAGTIGLYIFCAFAASQNIHASGPSISSSSIVIILSLFGLTFPIIAYLICQLMSCMDVFRPWIIVRNWAALCLALIMTAGFGLQLLGLIPYALASQIALIGYVGILIVDIRVCQSVGEMEWIPSIFNACAISVIGMLVLLAGFASAAGL